MTARLINVWIGEPCAGKLEFKQIRVTKSRMIGFCALQAGAGDIHTYLRKRFWESCAPQPPSEAGSYLCPTIHNTASCDDPALCDRFENETILRRDKFRSGCHPIGASPCGLPCTLTRYNCEKLESERDIRGPIHTCENIENTSVRYEGECEPDEDDCCDERRSIVEVLDPYTQAVLEGDIAAMRAAVDWTADFAGWNTAGDVIGLEEGHFIFPHFTASYFDAHHYLGTDHDDGAGPEWIAKAWMRVRNVGTQPIDVVQTFYPEPTDEEPDPEPVETTYTLDPEETRTIDPPATPGHTIVEEADGCAAGGASAISPCIGQFCSVHPNTVCEISDTETKASEGELPSCYFCAFDVDANGVRAMYLNRRVDYEGKLEYSHDHAYNTGPDDEGDYTNRWSSGNGEREGSISVSHEIVPSGFGCGINVSDCTGAFSGQYSANYGIDQQSYYSNGSPASSDDREGSAEMTIENTAALHASGGCTFSENQGATITHSAKLTTTGSQKSYGAPGTPDEGEVTSETAINQTVDLPTCSEEYELDSGFLGSPGNVCDPTWDGLPYAPTIGDSTSGVFFAPMQSVGGGWSSSVPCPPDEPDPPGQNNHPSVVLYHPTPGSGGEITETPSHGFSHNWTAETSTFEGKWSYTYHREWDFASGSGPVTAHYTRNFSGQFTAVVTLSNRVQISETATAETEEVECAAPVCVRYFERNPESSSDVIMRNGRADIELGFDQFNCGSPALYSKADIELRYYLIKTPDDCNEAVQSELKTHEISVETTVIGEDGAPKWGVPDSVNVPLNARSEMGGTPGEVCLRYPSAIVTKLYPTGSWEEDEEE